MQMPASDSAGEVGWYIIPKNGLRAPYFQSGLGFVFREAISLQINQQHSKKRKSYIKENSFYLEKTDKYDLENTCYNPQANLDMILFQLLRETWEVCYASELRIFFPHGEGILHRWKGTGIKALHQKYLDLKYSFICLFILNKTIYI